MSNYKQEIINELAIEILKKGYRVFLSSKGTYGFFTSQDGLKTVSFQYDLCGISFSGNYHTNKPFQTGSGWRISENNDLNIDNVFKSHPPQWALNGASFKFSTMKHQLECYSSSNFIEFKLHCDLLKEV